jgi:tight adherence protein C
MTQRLIPILVFFSVMALGGAILVIRNWRRRRLDARLYGEAQSSGVFGDAGGGGAAVSSPRFISTVEHIGRAVSAGKTEAGLREWLASAGYYEDSASTIYVGAQLVLGLLALTVGGAGAFSFDLPMLLRICIIVAVLSSFALLPNLVVTLRRRRRTAEVRRNLPDAIDLLEICVSSGMGLDMAWNAVSDEFRGVSGILADEMALSNLEMHLGAQRADALRNMAKRTGVEDLSSLVGTLVQSERFGTSVSQALRTYADAMRTERSQRAEEAAEKLTIKLLFPMVLFIFPCMFIVILCPAGLRMVDMFRGG